MKSPACPAILRISIIYAGSIATKGSSRYVEFQHIIAYEMPNGQLTRPVPEKQRFVLNDKYCASWRVDGTNPYEIHEIESPSSVPDSYLAYDAALIPEYHRMAVGGRRDFRDILSPTLNAGVCRNEVWRRHDGLFEVLSYSSKTLIRRIVFDPNKHYACTEFIVYNDASEHIASNLVIDYSKLNDLSDNWVPTRIEEWHYNSPTKGQAAGQPSSLLNHYVAKLSNYVFIKLPDEQFTLAALQMPEGEWVARIPFQGNAVMEYYTNGKTVDSAAAGKLGLSQKNSQRILERSKAFDEKAGINTTQQSPLR